MIGALARFALSGLLLYGFARMIAPKKEDVPPAPPAPPPTPPAPTPTVRGVVRTNVENRPYIVAQIASSATPVGAGSKGSVFEVRRADALDVWVIFDDNGELASSGSAEDLALLRADMARFPKNLFEPSQA